jgi:flavin-dependent dehydrogenase
MTGTDVAEVLVIGGGPAGAVCSLALARLGRRVVLCEANAFPRDHIGISLSPGVATQLDFLGLGHLLQHPAHRSRVAVERRWGAETFVTAPHFEAFIADRARLDADLLAAAGERGVRILQPARVGDLERETDGWTVGVSTPSGAERIRSVFVVDASGRRSRFRHRRRLGAATVAVCGDWTGHVCPVVRIAAASRSWSWTAPTGSNRCVAVAFTSPETLRRAEGSLENRYRRLLHAAGVLEPDLALAAKPYACEATP